MAYWGIFCVVASLAWGAESTSDRPNIVFIVADDHAEWALGCSGHPNARTPHLDQLAREGVRLTNCFTPTPVCSPSRVSILTSRYGTETGIEDWLNPKTEPQQGLDPATPAWPRLLAAAGYRTGLIGKWHLGIQDRFHPSQFGYQYFMGFREGGNSPQDPQLEINGEIRQVEGYIVDLLTDDALKFFQRDVGQPFALSLHFREPHRPYTPLPPAELKAFAGVDPVLPNPVHPQLDEKKVKQLTRDYLGSVAAIDRNVGRLLTELNRLGLADNTLVIYTSDHGYNIGHHGVWHKGNGAWILTKNPPGTPHIPEGWRPNMFDTSLRVPAIIRWPKQLPAGRLIDRTVTHLDWFPTLLEAAGVTLPAGTKIHGQSVLNLWRNQGTLARSDDLYSEYSVHHSLRADMRSYRTPDWKLTRDFLNPGRDELYHLKSDPHETQNLADSDRSDATTARRELSARIEARMQELKDPLLKTR
ncbi:MAG: sulfatase-like hydrolase/transferase [Planctomycetaceae bacterium]